MKTPSYYPVFLNVGGKKCVVVGGGQVALRKVKALLERGAKVVVVSPEPCQELKDMAADSEIKLDTRRYQTGDLKGALIVVAATDDREINRQVAKEARKCHALVNVVDDADISDFIAPSYLQRGNITIAISTAGSSPALARKIRTKLEEDFGEEYASLAALLEEVRGELKKNGTKVDSEDWQKALDLDLVTGLLKKGQKEKARAALLSSLCRTG